MCFVSGRLRKIKTKGSGLVSGVSWQTVGIMAALIAGHGAVILLAVKSMLENSKTHTDDKFTTLDKKISEEYAQLNDKISITNSESSRIERQLLEFQADLPKEYVRRDDWIRFSSVIDAKQDSLGAEVRTLSVQMQQVVDNIKTVKDDDNE